MYIMEQIKWDIIIYTFLIVYQINQDNFSYTDFYLPDLSKDFNSLYNWINYHCVSNSHHPTHEVQKNFLNYQIFHTLVIKFFSTFFFKKKI